jgi:hypothetical protein
MILTAESLTAAQACQRKGALTAEGWRPQRWLPKALFTHLLRFAITKICQGERPEDMAAWAEGQMLELAASPGLEVVADPYTVAKDYAAMLHVIIRSQFRSLQPRVPVLHELPLYRLSASCYWRFNSLQDESGELHRWVVWEAMSDERLSRELHGWATFGDITLARAHLVLHVILIGRRPSGGRQESGWARCWSSSMGIRFRRKTADAKSSSKRHKPNYDFDPFWKKQWLSDMRGQSPDEWVDQMWRDGEAQELTRRLEVKRPAAAVCAETERQLAEESERLLFMQLESKPWWKLPMSRGACDSFAPCAFQSACYQPDPAQEPQLVTLGYRQQAEEESRAEIEKSYRRPCSIRRPEWERLIPMHDKWDTGDPTGE